ncbi:FtsX-like permease family protein [Pseudonocardia sp. CA-107938]|uniref:FtsX-like permease family protein n=1 Tax=Pseudonocardia sp. CA-107938 TaxID=3240021 RepID=UPI003D9311A7
MSSFCWAGVRAVARAERRRRGLLLLAVLAGIVGAVVAGSAAVAERSATAYPRLVAKVGLDDARVLVPADQPALARAVPELPGVDHAWSTSGWVARIAGPALAYVSLGAGADRPGDLVRPVVVAGRAPDPAALDEVLVGEPVAARFGVRLGDELRLELLTLSQIARFDVGFGTPDGPAVTLRVVGVGRMPAWGGTLANFWASEAFARTYARTASAHAVFVRTTGPSGTAAFAEAYLAAARAAPKSIADRYLPPGVELPTSEVDPSVRAAEGAIVVGLAVFALVVAGAGALVVGQGLLRHHAGGRAAQEVELALGMTTGERVAARVLAAWPAAALATAIALAGGAAAGLLEPLGSQARFEPEPGFRLPVPVLVATVPVGMLLFLGGTALTAAAVVRAAAPGVDVRRPLPLTWLRRWPAVLVGVRLAARGRSAALAVGASAVATAGVVAAVVFGASLDRLVGEPARYGAGADFAVADARLGEIERLAADPRTAAVTVIRTSTATLAGGRTVPAVVAFSYKGPVGVTVAAGRLPARAGEIAIGQRLAGATGAQIGDVVPVEGTGGVVPLTVTGIVVAPPTDQRYRLGDDIVLAGEQAVGVTSGAALYSASVLAMPGQADALMTELGARLEIEPRQVPTEIRTLADLRSLPEVLAAALGVLVAAGAVYELTATRRRYAREIAVLAVTGQTPAQVRATLAVVAVATVGPGLLIGVPLGIGVARVLWWQVATATGVGAEIVVPAVVPGVVSGVLLVALGAAVVPVLRGVGVLRVS